MRPIWPDHLTIWTAPAVTMARFAAASTSRTVSQFGSRPTWMGRCRLGRGRTIRSGRLRRVYWRSPRVRHLREQAKRSRVLNESLENVGVEIPFVRFGLSGRIGAFDDRSGDLYCPHGLVLRQDRLYSGHELLQSPQVLDVALLNQPLLHALDLRIEWRRDFCSTDHCALCRPDFVRQCANRLYGTAGHCGIVSLLLCRDDPNELPNLC